MRRCLSLLVVLAGCSASTSGTPGTPGADAGVTDSTTFEVSTGDASPETADGAVEDTGFDIAPVDAELPPDGPCTIVGAKEAYPCGVCGRTERVCLATKLWGPFSTCLESPPECAPFATRTTTDTCGKCGKTTQSCSSFCKWEKSGCVAEGPCAPGESDDVAGGCPSVLEVKSRICGSDCTFGTIGACHLPKGWQKLADPPEALGGRSRGVGVAMGTQILVFGGDVWTSATPTANAAIYTLASNTWTTASAPVTNRSYGVGAYTGTEALLWGGLDDSSTYPTDGLRYKPGVGWSKTSSAPIAGRSFALGMWSDATQELVVWGGIGGPTASDYLADGAAYAPATNTWRKLPAPPLARTYVRGGNVGGKLLLFAGLGSGCGLECADGQLYDPATNAWSTLAKSSLSDRRDTALVLGASLDVLFGADKTGKYAGDGAHHDGAIWKAIGAAPAGTFERRQAWTFRSGTSSYLWSGADKTGNFRVDGIAYDSATSTWSNMPVKNAPPARNETTFVFTGSEAYFIGGFASSAAGAVGLRDAYVFRP